MFNCWVIEFSLKVDTTTKLVNGLSFDQAMSEGNDFKAKFFIVFASFKLVMTLKHFSSFNFVIISCLYGILSMLNGFEIPKIDPLRPYSKFCIKRIVLFNSSILKKGGDSPGEF